MKYFLPLIALLISVSQVHAQDNKAALREISTAYDQIEKNYKTWTHFSMGAENLEGGQSFTNDLWVNSEGDDRLIKLESHSYDDHGETKAQFFFKGDRLLFTLDRHEEVLIEPNATDVVEMRSYFADNKLIRALRKKGRFAAGTPRDTISIKNVEVPVEPQAAGDETPEEAYRNQHELAAPLMQKLLHLDDDDAPVPAKDAAAPEAAKTPWRVIAGSASRDGSQALAWGLKGKASPTGEVREDGTLSVDPDDKDLVNYIVNLRDNTVVGTITGKHFGDRATYNHNTTQATWSLVGDFVAHVNSGKWATYDAFIYPTQGGANGGPIKGADLLAAVKKAAKKQLAGHKTLKGKEVEDFALTLNEVVIMGTGDDTRVWVDATGQIAKDEDAGGYDCAITFKLTGDENGGAPKLTLLKFENHHD